MKILFFLLSAFISVQANALTINLEKEPPQVKKLKKKPEGPVVLDARGGFDYTMSHYVGSLPIRWEDYSQTEEPFKGLLDPDLGLLARKLRLLGVAPDREVIVLGRGSAGWGEEGRIAWMLSYLGVRNIRVIGFGELGGKKSSGEPSPALDVPMWIPKPNEGIRIRKTELSQIVQNKTQQIVLIDVRENSEFSGRKNYGEKRSGHIPGAINIPWQEFVTQQGTPIQAEKLTELLKSKQIDPTHELVFYCTGGVRSGFATFAALKAGLKARNFDGSFWEWAADPQLPIEK